MSERLRLLWISDSPLLATGFARVSREVCSRLARHPKVDLAALGWGHDPATFQTSLLSHRLYAGSGDTFGRDSFEAVVLEFRPSLVVSLGELHSVKWLAEAPSRDSWKWVAYVPIDGSPFYEPWGRWLSSVDQVVAMSEFGRTVLQEGMPKASVISTP